MSSDVAMFEYNFEEESYRCQASTLNYLMIRLVRVIQLAQNKYPRKALNRQQEFNYSPP